MKLLKDFKTLSKNLIVGAILLCFCLSFSSCAEKSKYTWAGCRSSCYGFGKEFPTPEQFVEYAKEMSSNYEGSKPAFIWIVGNVLSENPADYSDEYGFRAGAVPYCHLGFPVDESITVKKDHIQGSEEDEYEPYLSLFDENGIEVWLQVESGDADLVQLAQIVLNRYKHHKCVKGFGIDVEWYIPAGTRGEGTILTDDVAIQVNEAVKAINKDYSVFVKHWDESRLPSKDVSPDLMFVNDSQGFSSLKQFKKEFLIWAEDYDPNPVMFQIGYDADKRIWKKMENPAYELGAAIEEGLPASKQKRGVIWVDFTLRKVMKK